MISGDKISHSIAYNASPEEKIIFLAPMEWHGLMAPPSESSIEYASTVHRQNQCLH